MKSVTSDRGKAMAALERESSPRQPTVIALSGDPKCAYNELLLGLR